SSECCIELRHVDVLLHGRCSVRENFTGRDTVADTGLSELDRAATAVEHGDPEPRLKLLVERPEARASEKDRLRTILFNREARFSLNRGDGRVEVLLEPEHRKIDRAYRYAAGGEPRAVDGRSDLML